jgi:hypothetical protein
VSIIRRWEATACFTSASVIIQWSEAMQITGQGSAEITVRPPCSPNLAPSDLHLSRGKQFAEDTDVKQAVTSSLQTLDTRWYQGGKHTSVPMMTTWRSGVYHLLQVLHIHIVARMFSESERCLSYFLKLFLNFFRLPLAH